MSKLYFFQMESYTVSQISALFHDFEDTGQINLKYGEKGKKRGKALLLATLNRHEDKQEVQKQLGIYHEDKMLDSYENKTGKKIRKRNEELYTMTIKHFKIVGKVDGIVEDEGILIEHKRRVHGILNRVPYHELVQCYFYMKMLQLTKTHLIETFGSFMKIHEILFDETIWQTILLRVF